MSKTTVDLVLKDLAPNEAQAVLDFLAGDIKPTGKTVGEVIDVESEEKSKPKAKVKPKAKRKTKAQKEAEAKAKVEDEANAAVAAEEDDDDWDDDEDDSDDDSDEDDSDDKKYASIKKWRELATTLVGDGYDTEEKLLAKCESLRGTVPALEKIPPENLTIRVSRAIEVLGA